MLIKDQWGMKLIFCKGENCGLLHTGIWPVLKTISDKWDIFPDLISEKFMILWNKRCYWVHTGSNVSVWGPTVTSRNRSPRLLIVWKPCYQDEGLDLLAGWKFQSMKPSRAEMCAMFAKRTVNNNYLLVCTEQRGECILQKLSATIVVLDSALHSGQRQ